MTVLLNQNRADHGTHVLQEDSHEKYRVVDPTQESHWDESLKACNGVSLFHTAAWPKVLRETYGHRPMYVCRFDGGKIEALLPIIEVASRITGTRGVSLPFADYCNPLGPVERHEELFTIAKEFGRKRGWRYLEWRTNDFHINHASAAVEYHQHLVQLDGELGAMFQRMDSAVRRAVRKAEKGDVRVNFSTDPEAMRTFYALHCGTRRKHGVPPQPSAFVENIGRHVLQKGNGFVATAVLGAQPIAASVFFHYGRTALYKYGASDERFQHARGNNLLMWEAMQRCRKLGCEALHLGRTSLGQEGLRRFKLGLGAVERRLSYYRYDFRRGEFARGVDRAKSRLANLFRIFPKPLFLWTGKMLYPHLS